MSFVRVYCPNCKKEVTAKAAPPGGSRGIKVFVCPRCGKKL